MNGHNINGCRYKCTKCTYGIHITYEIAKDRQRDKASFTEGGDSKTTFYSYLNTMQKSQDLWYVDNGCSNRMTGDKSSFVQLDESTKLNITLADGRTQEVAGKETIAMKDKNGFTKYVQDSLCVLDLASNLLSVGQLI